MLVRTRVTSAVLVVMSLVRLIFHPYREDLQEQQSLLAPDAISGVLGAMSDGGRQWGRACDDR